MSCEPVTPQDLFVCRNCGQCCKGFGGTFVTEAEIDDICRHLGMDREGFVGRYCQISGGKPLIAQGENGYCLFWDHRCMIHPVKPHMCRQWPFIESVLIDAGNWQSMAASCPGMRTDFREDQIQKCVHDVLNGNDNFNKSPQDAHSL